MEPNAFADLLERPNECSALECENKHGRSYSSTNNPLMLCSTCGSTAIHRLCLPPPRSNRFHCADCTIAMEERDSGRESLNSHPNTNDNELDEIDVCNVSDHENLEIIQALFVDNVPNSPQEEGLCSSDDEIRTKRQRQHKLRILSSDSDSSNISKENMKPSNENTNPTKSNITTSSQKISGEEAATNSTRRKVLYAIEEDEVEISHNSRNRLTKIRTPSRVMVADIADSSDAESDCIPRRRTQISTKSVIDDEDDDLQTELEEKTNVQSHDNYVHKQEKERKLSTSTEDDLIIKPHVRRVARIHSYEEDDNDVTIPRKQAKTEPKNEASIKNSICSTGSRSKIFNTIDDSDEDETSDSETISEEQKTDSVLSESASDESEEDDDPLENFTKLMEKQKNISCVARRTRSAHAENHHQKFSTKPSCSNVDSIKQSASMKKTIRFKQPNQSSAKSDNLDISCIAKRTRRKSMFCERTISEERCSNPIQNTKQLEISCVALRTRGRRETVCSETFTEKNKHEQRRRKNSKIRNGKTMLDESDESSSPYQVSQIYEKEHETDDDMENVVVPDNCMEYENSNKCKLSALEISCIANRTRKHKSVKPIEVIDEESSSSCYSISSSSTCGTDLVPSRLSRYNEKFPNQSVECFKSKTNQQKQQSYHPSNYHHPHINNRRRI